MEPSAASNSGGSGSDRALHHDATRSTTTHSNSVRAQRFEPPLRVTTTGVSGDTASAATSSSASTAAGVAAARPSGPLSSAAPPPSTTSPAALAGDSARQHKRVLVACRLGSHTIEKCASPKKKALDPMRYMPDRAAFYALFTVHVQFEGASTDHQVYRTYKQLGALHSRLQKKYPKSNFPKDLPSMRKKRYDNEYIEQKKQALNQYLAQVLALPELRQSKTLREFLEDSRLSDDSDDEDANPMARLLEGRPGTIVTVRAGQSFSVTLALPHAGDIISWQFTTKKHNIGFSATFNGETICVYSREDSQHKPIKGYYTCTAPGVCTLNWDNTYTWSKGKVLVYWAEVEHQTQSQDARASASPILGALPSPVEPTSGSSDARRSGYIETNRNHALYPRRIVNSSISLITKPFVSGSKAHGQQQQLTYKSGPLIIERNIKFRGRHWYRKWFVLDTRKCLLRYYDSESAARKGLSLAKLNLNHKNASLAVTSGEDAAPTPYTFIARTRKQSWKICASSLTEYNEWEHAISTAILTAQLSKRHRSGSGGLGPAVSSSGASVHGGAGTSSSPGAGYAASGTGNPLLREHAGRADDSDDSDDDDDEEDDDDDEELAKDGDDDDAAIHLDRREHLAMDADARSTSLDHRNGLLFSAAVERASAWELKWKLAVLASVNALVLSLRVLPLEAIGALLLLCNACAVALKITTARQSAKAKQA